MTSRYIKFARQYERTHEDLRRHVEDIREIDRILATPDEIILAEFKRQRGDPATYAASMRARFDLHPPIDPTAANNPWWVG